MGLIAQMFVAYAVSYAVTYIATGSAKAAQSAGLGAALFMGIGGLRGGKMGANGKMQYKWVIHSTVHMYQPHLINVLMTCKASVG
jgi:hypothetical protein